LIPEHWGPASDACSSPTPAVDSVETALARPLLWVLARNERAKRFYQADGWALDGARRTEDLGGVTVDEVRYQRSLP